MSDAQPEPRSLSTEYHRARKQLLLWSAILLGWSLIGIDLEKVKEAEGNVGVLMRAIKSPQAVPWVLLILIGYFIFKVTIEWRQSSQGRRKLRVAKIDYYSAVSIAVIAYFLYFGQIVSRIQIADFLQSHSAPIWASMVGGMIAIEAILAVGYYRQGSKEWITTIAPGVLLLLLRIYDGRYRLLTLWGGLSAICLWGIYRVVRRVRTWRSQRLITTGG